MIRDPLPSQGNGVVLLVGLTASDTKVLFEESDGSSIRAIQPSELNVEIIRDLAPDLVMSPLMTGRTDAIEIADLLGESGFAGTYVAVARGLSRPEIIEREITSRAPDFSFKIMMLPSEQDKSSSAG